MPDGEWVFCQQIILGTSQILRGDDSLQKLNLTTNPSSNKSIRAKTSERPRVFMAEEEEEAFSRHQQESSKGSIPRVKRPHRRQQPKAPKEPTEPGESKDSKENGSTSEAPRRRRPDRRERQRRKQVAESSAPTAGAASSITNSNLNPSASEFIPRQHSGVVDTAMTAQSGSNTGRGNTDTARANRGRPRGGRRGRSEPQRNGKENESAASTDETVQTAAIPSQPRRPRDHGNARIQVQPKIVKESEDLMLRMTEALSKGDYDCSICTDSV